MVRSKLTYANVMVTVLAVAVLGGGTAVAGGLIDSGDIAKNGVRASDVAPNAVGLQELADNAAGANELRRNSVRSRHIRNGEIVDEDVDADALTGAEINESTLDVFRPGACQDGTVKGFALVLAPDDKAAYTTPPTYTSAGAFIADAYNCAEVAPEVRIATFTLDGEEVKYPTYYVRFPNSNARVAQVTQAQSANAEGAEEQAFKFSAVRIDSGPDAGSFRVDMTETLDDSFHVYPGNVPFQITVM